MIEVNWRNRIKWSIYSCQHLAVRTVLIKHCVSLLILLLKLDTDRRYEDTVMDNLVYIVVFLSYFAYPNQGLVLQKAVEDTNFYEVDTIKESDDRPLLDYFKNSEDKSELAYIVLMPKDSQEYKVLLDNSEDYSKYVIIKTKPKLLDLDPYSLVPRVDKSKQMVMWLNVYCEMHPDCDKNKLNEELMKIRPYLQF